MDKRILTFQREAVWHEQRIYFVFLAAATLALAAFFLLLLIITIPRNDPTIVVPRRVRMTGMRMAQTRGGNRR